MAGRTDPDMLGGRWRAVTQQGREGHLGTQMDHRASLGVSSRKNNLTFQNDIDELIYKIGRDSQT